ncbi:MAG: D,D-dipeptide ABC transporter permease, partial [Alphaproteobacteria bacterium]|nr:D,D-dipeptide ABC transporter permease [Alphaproteobacteria bacterium]
MSALASPAELLRRIAATPMGIVGGSLLLLVLAAAILGPPLSPHDPIKQVLRPDRIFLPPAGDALLGTDNL